MKHNLTTLRLLTGRHVKLYFKDRVNFFMSLITPLILLVLFVTFLKNVYSSSFTSMMPKGYQPDSGIILRVPDELTAAKAFVPRYLPTMNASAVLYSCWKT